MSMYYFHWLDGHEFEWTPGVGDGQGGLACWDSWGRKESDTTGQLNWTELIFTVAYGIFSYSPWDLVPWPGIELGHLYWEWRVLATGPPEVLPSYMYFYWN